MSGELVDGLVPPLTCFVLVLGTLVRPWKTRKGTKVLLDLLLIFPRRMSVRRSTLWLCDGVSLLMGVR